MRHAHGGGVPCGTAAGGRRNALRCTFHGKPYKFPCDVLGALGADVPEDEFEAMRLLQEKTGVPAPASLAGLREKPYASRRWWKRTASGLRRLLCREKGCNENGPCISHEPFLRTFFDEA